MTSSASVLTLLLRVNPVSNNDEMIVILVSRNTFLAIEPDDRKTKVSRTPGARGIRRGDFNIPGDFFRGEILSIATLITCKCNYTLHFN